MLLVGPRGTIAFIGMTIVAISAGAVGAAGAACVTLERRWTLHLGPRVASGVPIPACVSLSVAGTLMELPRWREGLADAAGVNRSLGRSCLGGAAGGGGRAEPHAGAVGLVETDLGQAVVTRGQQRGLLKRVVVVGAAVGVAQLRRATQADNQTGQAVVLVIQTFQFL